MAMMNNGGFIFPVNPVFDGMTPNFVSQCVPVTVGVGDRVPVRVGASVTVSQTTGQSIVQMTAQPVTVLVPVQQGITNPVQQHGGGILQGDEVAVGEVQAEGDALREFVQNFGGVAIKIWAKAQQNSQQLETLAELSKEIAISNQVTKEIAEEVTENIVRNMVLQLRASGTSAEAVRQSFVKAGVSFFESNNLVNAFYSGDEAFVNYLDNLLVKSPDIVKQANEIVKTSAARVSTLVCPLKVGA